MTSNPFSIVLDKNKIQVQLQLSKECVQGYIDVSEVGRMAMGSSRSEFPLLLVNLMPSR
jgi:hypothetical protein